MPLTRRQMLRASGAALLGPAVASRVLAGPSKAAPKKVLFFTKSSGFQHSVITRKGADSGDPLAQSQSVGWKAYWTAKVLNDTWAVIIRSKSTFA